MNILHLHKQRSKDVIKIVQEWGVQILITQKDAVTKITGIKTPKSIDALENEFGGAFTILKSTHFAKGEQYGYLACAMPEEK